MVSNGSKTARDAQARRIERAIRLRGLDYSKVAQQLSEAGLRVTPQAVRKWAVPGPEGSAPLSHRWAQLAEILKVREPWLRYGDGAMYVSEIEPVPQVNEATMHYQNGDKTDVQNTVRALLPPEMQAGIAPALKVAGHVLRPLFASPSVVVDVCRARYVTHVCRTCLPHLWHLALLARTDADLGISRRYVCVCLSGEDVGAQNPRIADLVWEAQVHGVEFKTVTSEGEIADIITAG